MSDADNTAARLAAIRDKKIAYACEHERAEALLLAMKIAQGYLTKQPYSTLSMLLIEQVVREALQADELIMTRWEWRDRDQAARELV